MNKSCLQGDVKTQKPLIERGFADEKMLKNRVWPNFASLCKNPARLSFLRINPNNKV